MRKQSYYIVILIPLFLLAALPSAGAQTPPPEPGVVEGTGTYFEITDSEYLNITLQSSAALNLTLISAPQTVFIKLEAAAGAAQTDITLTGLIPDADYYMYTDNYHNQTAFTADASGGYCFCQDLGESHLLFIQPHASTYFLAPDAGQIPPIGSWDEDNRVFTLNTDIDQTIQIDQGDLTLDGNGHTITGAGSGNGIYLFGYNNVHITDLTIEGFAMAVHGNDCDDCSFTDLTIVDNYRGIYLMQCLYSTIADNDCHDNAFGLYLYACSLDTIENNSAQYNMDGIFIRTQANQNTFRKNNTSNNSRFGFYMWWCSDNTFTENISSNNVSTTESASGFFIVDSDHLVFTGNTAENNSSSGIRLNNNSNITLTCNTLAFNHNGVYLNSTNTAVYNNNFLSNSSRQIFVTGNYTGNVYCLPPPDGGNFWNDWTPPDHPDSNPKDGFVDDPYVFWNGQDDYPWTRKDGWLNEPPVADAGIDQSVHPVTAVTLDGSGSTDPDNNYPLTYSWVITARPPTSAAELSDPHAVNPSFFADVLGDYTVELIVTDKLFAQSQPDQVLISTYNTPPVADAGEDIAVIQLGSYILLDGTQSWDADDDDLTYFWEMIQKPQQSLAALDDPACPTPAFIADTQGDYLVNLTVTDIFNAVSQTDTVIVSFTNVKPVAHAGGNQSVIVGDAVFLDGNLSSDANLDPLTFNWSFVAVPPESLAVLYDPAAPVPYFFADAPGAFIISLVVNDGFEDSEPVNVTVMAITSQQAAATILIETIETINNLPLESLRNKKLVNPLTNKINAVLAMIDQENYGQALNKLQNDILQKTNGCAEIGQPDRNDWIETCESQAQVYPLIIETIELLKRLI